MGFYAAGLLCSNLDPAISPIIAQSKYEEGEGLLSLPLPDFCDLHMKTMEPPPSSNNWDETFQNVDLQSSRWRSHFLLRSNNLCGGIWYLTRLTREQTIISHYVFRHIVLQALTGVLEKAILAEQLFGDDMWGPWADCTRTGSYEFEGIGEGHFILIH